MSTTEAHKGKLMPMILRGVSLEERCRAACSVLGFVKNKYHSSYEECLRDEGYRKVYIRNQIIYEVQDTELDPSGFSEAETNEDGSIDYMILYYNGGASFDEVIDEAISNIEEADD